jgi:hypothetical protein
MTALRDAMMAGDVAAVRVHAKRMLEERRRGAARVLRDTALTARHAQVRGELPVYLH